MEEFQKPLIDRKIKSDKIAKEKCKPFVCCSRNIPFHPNEIFSDSQNIILLLLEVQDPHIDAKWSFIRRLRFRKKAWYPVTIFVFTFLIEF